MLLKKDRTVLHCLSSFIFKSELLYLPIWGKDSDPTLTWIPLWQVSSWNVGGSLWIEDIIINGQHQVEDYHKQVTSNKDKALRKYFCGPLHLGQLFFQDLNIQYHVIDFLIYAVYSRALTIE